MHQRRKILVVAPSAPLAGQLVTWLGEGHDELVMVSTFSAAMVYLARQPDLLITEIKLGAYNGLHLAWRGHNLGIPAIVLGAEPRFDREARQLGATYLPTEQLTRAELHALIQTLLFTRETWSWSNSAAAEPHYFDAATVVH